MAEDDRRLQKRLKTEFSEFKKLNVKFLRVDPDVDLSMELTLREYILYLERRLNTSALGSFGSKVSFYIIYRYKISLVYIYCYYRFPIEISGERIFQMVFIKSMVYYRGVIGVKWYVLYIYILIIIMKCICLFTDFLEW